MLVLTGDLRVDSRDIAGALEVQHKNVMELIERHQSRFEVFGSLAFETEVRPGQQISGGGLPSRFVSLNEDQCYLLLTFSRNTERVADLKVKLIELFREARKPAQHQLPASYLEALKALVASEEAKQLAEEQSRVLQITVAEQQPLVDAYTEVMDSSGLLTVQQVAALLCWGEVNLFRMMRTEGILMDGKKAGRDQHNQPYRRWIESGHFEVKTTAYQDQGGTEHLNNRTFVTGKGLDMLRRKFGSGKKQSKSPPNLRLALPA